MSDNRIIKGALITAYPKSFADPMPEVRVQFEEGGSYEPLFTFYPDEISFSAEEFIGLTVDEARALRTKKDIAYLQS